MRYIFRAYVVGPKGEPVVDLLEHASPHVLLCRLFGLSRSNYMTHVGRSGGGAGVKFAPPMLCLSRSLKVIEAGIGRSDTYDLLLVIRIG